jgi:hypothetical protein
MKRLRKSTMVAMTSIVMALMLSVYFVAGVASVR